MNLAFTSYSEMSSEVSVCESKEELTKKMLEDNKARCDFFKHFLYNDNQAIGSVSIAF